MFIQGMVTGGGRNPVPWISLNISMLSIFWWFLFVGSSSSLQLAEEDVVRNITHWTLLGHHNSSAGNDSTATPPPLDPADVPRGPCWETTVGIVRNSLCSKSLCWPGMVHFCFSHWCLWHFRAWSFPHSQQLFPPLSYSITKAIQALGNGSQAIVVKSSAGSNQGMHSSEALAMKSTKGQAACSHTCTMFSFRSWLCLWSKPLFSIQCCTCSREALVQV